MQSNQYLQTFIIQPQTQHHIQYQINQNQSVKNKQSSKLSSNKITNPNPTILLNDKKIINKQIHPFLNNNLLLAKIQKSSSHHIKYKLNQTNSINFYKNYPEFNQKNLKTYKKTFFQFAHKQSKPLSVHQMYSKDSLYENIIVKRTFGTAPLRNRIKTEFDKENILNCEDLIDKKSLNKSKSTLFNPIQSKIRISSEFKSKPTILYNSSKLPKDFFLKQHKNNLFNHFSNIKNNKDNQNTLQTLTKNTQTNKGHQRVFSCPKIINKQINKINELPIDQIFKPRQNNIKFSQKSKLNNNLCEQQQFTFRKSSKNIKNVQQNFKEIDKNSFAIKQNKQADQKQHNRNIFLDQFRTTKDFLQVSPINFSFAEGKKKFLKIQNKTKKEILLKL